MAIPKQNIDRLYKIINKHCLKFGPSLEAVGQTYGNQQRIIWEQNTAEEKIFTRFYVCPLCVSNVIMATGGQIYQTSDFDRDHFPAKSIGGRKTILVCKSCNSKYGREIDYSVKEHHTYYGFLKNQSAMTAKITLEGLVENYTVQLTRKDDLTFTLTDPSRRSYLGQQMGNLAKQDDITKIPLQIKIRQKVPPAAVFEKSLLKAAYLYFFSVMGYEFVYSVTGTSIRKVLAGTIEHPLSNHGVLPDLEDSPLTEGIYMLVEPVELKSFFVLLETKLPQAGIAQKHMVIIPSMFTGSWEKLKAFEPIVKKREGIFSQIKLTEEAISQLSLLSYSQLSQMFLRTEVD